MSKHLKGLLTDSEVASLVCRMELLPQLVRRQQEELILDRVPLPSEWLEEHRQAFLMARILPKCLIHVVGVKVISIFISNCPRHCVVSPNNVLVLD